MTTCVSQRASIKMTPFHTLTIPILTSHLGALLPCSCLACPLLLLPGCCLLCALHPLLLWLPGCCCLCLLGLVPVSVVPDRQAC